MTIFMDCYAFFWFTWFLCVAISMTIDACCLCAAIHAHLKSSEGIVLLVLFIVCGLRWISA